MTTGKQRGGKDAGSDRSDDTREGGAGEGTGQNGAKAARNERLKAALRNNLKRRKAQQRGRSATGEPEDETGE